MVEFDRLLELAFLNFALDLNISDPFQTDFVEADAFTWNYGSVNVLDVFYPTVATNAGKPFSKRFKTINELIFNTRYPHLEPWKLQGYTGEPDFWAGLYDWRKERTITDVDQGADEFEIFGDFTAIFTAGTIFTVQNSTGNDGSFTVDVGGSTFNGIETVIPVTAAIPDPTIDGEILTAALTDVFRRWEPLMWSNIGDGIVPTGELLPNGVTVSTGAVGEVEEYTHFSVNIFNETTSDNFEPDDLLPPFYSSPSASAIDVAVELQALIRSIFNVPNREAGYVFGDIGPVERRWRQSSQFLYDQLTIAFQMQPMRFLHDTFGVEFGEVGFLQYNLRTDKVFSHKDTVFHGDLVETDSGSLEPIIFEGLNQWYVNFNRANSFDSQLSDFRPLWTEWDPVLSYQFNTFADTLSLLVVAKKLRY